MPYWDTLGLAILGCFGFMLGLYIAWVMFEKAGRRGMLGVLAGAAISAVVGMMLMESTAAWEQDVLPKMEAYLEENPGDSSPDGYDAASPPIEAFLYPDAYGLAAGLALGGLLFLLINPASLRPAEGIGHVPKLEAETLRTMIKEDALPFGVCVRCRNTFNALYDACPKCGSQTDFMRVTEDGDRSLVAAAVLED